KPPPNSTEASARTARLRTWSSRSTSKGSSAASDASGVSHGKTIPRKRREVYHPAEVWTNRTGTKATGSALGDEDDDPDDPNADQDQRRDLVGPAPDSIATKIAAL